VLVKSSYEAPYLGPEVGRPGRSTHSQEYAFKFKIAPHKQNSIVKK